MPGLTDITGGDLHTYYCARCHIKHGTGSNYCHKCGYPVEKNSKNLQSEIIICIGREEYLRTTIPGYATKDNVQITINHSFRTITKEVNNESK